MNLNAIDTDELKIIGTILQDGLIEVSDIKYLPSIRSFFLMITRFMWEEKIVNKVNQRIKACLLYTSPSPRDGLLSRMPSSA